MSNATATATTHGSDMLQLATFYVADLCLALEIDQIQEIMRNVSATRVPHAPVEVSGVINLRGEVTTVIDLRRVLGLPENPSPGSSRTLIVRSQEESIGLVVDRVADIYAVAHQEIVPPPPNVGRVDGRFFRGVCPRESEIVVVMDLEETLGNLTSASK
jgi:purine-binding chemotaxis protein CheW